VHSTQGTLNSEKAFSEAAFDALYQSAKWRDEREFALAWAIREGFANPQMVAEWAFTLGRSASRLNAFSEYSRAFLNRRSLKKAQARSS
jgi:predicted ATPase